MSQIRGVHCTRVIILIDSITYTLTDRPIAIFHWTEQVVFREIARDTDQLIDLDAFQVGDYT